MYFQDKVRTADDLFGNEERLKLGYKQQILMSMRALNAHGGRLGPCVVGVVQMLLFADD